MISLLKVLRYIIERPGQMNRDAVLGVTIAEANINAGLQHKNIILFDNHEIRTLNNVLKQCEYTRRILLLHSNLVNNELDKMNVVLNQPNIWTKPIIWKSISPEGILPLPDNYSTVTKVIKSIFSGHPQESESNYCFSQLIHQCKFTVECQELITKNSNGTKGYPLTHRLFILKVMSVLGCKNSILQDFTYFTFKFCSLILQDLINLEAMDFPYVSKDLASEQILLCGMEGYIDFLNDHYQQLILDWQHPSGCYSGVRNSPYFERSFKIRTRRSGNFTDFGCINHATGLGAANLALLIRKDIEMITTFPKV